MTDTPDDDTYLDEDKIIDLASRKDLKTPRLRNSRPKGSAPVERARKVREMCREEVVRSDASRLTEPEETFAALLVNGSSLADAYEEAFPEKCYTLEPQADGSTKKEYLLSYNARFERGNRLTKQSGIRARVILLLEQEEVEVAHTSRRLDNLILKNLEKEATNPLNPANSRILALKQLQAHRAVQVSEQQAAERAKADLAPEELLAQIQERIKKFSE